MSLYEFEHAKRAELGIKYICGVDEAVVHMALIAFFHIPAEISPVHGAVIAGNNDGGVLVERLLHDPLHKFVNLPGGAGDHIFILLRVFIDALATFVAADMMGIHGQHGKSKRLVLLGHFTEG